MSKASERSLYVLLGSNSKESLLKSVFLVGGEGYKNEFGNVEFAVEAYDDFFVKSRKNRDKVFKYVDKMIGEYMTIKGIDSATVTHHSLFDSTYTYTKSVK